MLFRSKKGYIFIEREFKNGDQVQIEFEMIPRKNYAHPSVREDLRKVALSRGPLIYCLEEIDNGSGITRMFLGRDSEIREIQGELEEEEIDLEVTGRQFRIDEWDNSLYRFERPNEYEEKILKYIPYYLWNNRGVGEMAVWMHEIDI